MATKMSPLNSIIGLSGGPIDKHGWENHAPKELARRKRHRMMAHKSRKINQKVARG